MKPNPTTCAALLVLALAVAACGQVAPPVAAEERLSPLGQEKGQHAVTFALSCAGVGTFTVATNDRSFGTAFDLVGTNDVFHITEFAYTVRDGGGTVVEEGVIPTGRGGRKGLQGRLLTCTATDSFTRDGVVLNVFSTYRGFIAPRGKV